MLINRGRTKLTKSKPRTIRAQNRIPKRCCGRRVTRKTPKSAISKRMYRIEKKNSHRRPMRTVFLGRKRRRRQGCAPSFYLNGYYGGVSRSPPHQNVCATESSGVKIMRGRQSDTLREPTMYKNYCKKKKN